MSANTSTPATISKPIVAVEKVELRYQSTLLSDSIVNKQERHFTTGKLNKYTFDLTDIPKELFERALVGELNINGIILAEITNIAISLESKRLMTVEFLSALN